MIWTILMWSAVLFDVGFYLLWRAPSQRRHKEDLAEVANHFREMGEASEELAVWCHANNSEIVKRLEGLGYTRDS